MRKLSPDSHDSHLYALEVRFVFIIIPLDYLTNSYALNPIQEIVLRLDHKHGMVTGWSNKNLIIENIQSKRLVVEQSIWFSNTFNCLQICYPFSCLLEGTGYAQRSHLFRKQRRWACERERRERRRAFVVARKISIDAFLGYPGTVATAARIVAALKLPLHRGLWYTPLGCVLCVGLFIYLSGAGPMTCFALNTPLLSAGALPCVAWTTGAIYSHYRCRHELSDMSWIIQGHGFQPGLWYATHHISGWGG